VSDESISPPGPAAPRQRLVRVLPGAGAYPGADPDWAFGGVDGPGAVLSAGGASGATGQGAGQPPRPDEGVLSRLGGAAAFDPGRPGVRVLAAVAALVVLGAAVLAWWSRPHPEAVVPELTATGPPSPVVTEPPELVVAVSGKVHEPGLVRLTPGARVADAIEAAGGLLPDVELEHLNLARKVVDGELIAVGIPPPPGAATGPGGTGAKVNLNTATQAELETLPGVGPALAQRIIDYRTSNGQFHSVSELRQVSGIGEVRYAELRDRVTV